MQDVVTAKIWSDGTGREPRLFQSLNLDVISDEFASGTKVVAANMPPGTGKSFFARALQRELPPCDIITSDNTLIGQYCDTYPELNAVIGKDHYKTEEEYHDAHKAARTFPSIFNPLSYFYARERGLRVPNVLVCDEAHLLVDQLTYLSSYIIPVHRTKVPENAKTERDLIEWCYQRYDKLKEVMSGQDVPGTVYREFEKIARLRATLAEGSQHQLFSITKSMLPHNGRMTKCLVLQPLRVPEALVRSVTDAHHVLAMSGTMSKYDALQIAAGRDHVYFQHPYLTPPENRPVLYRPVAREQRKDPKVLAEQIRKIYLANPVPTLVHTTYSQQQMLASELEDLKPLVNGQKNKSATKERFLVRGGIWLAAGCAEGLDLPYAACEQMIIPTLLFPDKGSAFVQKRIGLEDGRFWYLLRTYQNTVQRLGRGVRAADDKCVSWILDPAFSQVYSTVSDQLAPLAVDWGTNG